MPPDLQKAFEEFEKFAAETHPEYADIGSAFFALMNKLDRTAGVLKERQVMDKLTASNVYKNPVQYKVALDVLNVTVRTLLFVEPTTPSNPPNPSQSLN